MRLPESGVKSVENKQYFDEDLSVDSLHLLEAAAALEVKEYTLFELAYGKWYGKKLLNHAIEAHFANYMFDGHIPAWVRSFSRQVVELHERDQLNPRDFGVYQPLPSKRLIRIGRAFSAFLVLSFVVIVIGGIGSIRGAFVAALVVGIVETVGRSILPFLLEFVVSNAAAQTAGPALASMLIYVVMAGVLFLRPQGLFTARTG